MSTTARKRLAKDFKRCVECNPVLHLAICFVMVVYSAAFAAVRIKDEPPVGITAAPDSNNFMLWNAVIFGCVIPATHCQLSSAEIFQDLRMTLLLLFAVRTRRCFRTVCSS